MLRSARKQCQPGWLARIPAGICMYYVKKGPPGQRGALVQRYICGYRYDVLRSARNLVEIELDTMTRVAEPRIEPAQP